MENSLVVDKENLFQALDFSPILSSGGISKQKLSSPLSDRNHACQNDRCHSSGTRRTAKISFLLSTQAKQSPTLIPDSWEEIRKLDEEELWIERTEVVTKEDHILYFEIAKEIIENIVKNLPVFNMEENSIDCDNAVVAREASKDGMGVLDSVATQNGDVEDIIDEEKTEELTTDMKTVAHDNEKVNSVSPQNNEQDDNDFIHSCSELDTTIQEVSANENTLSEDSEDLNETVKEIKADELQANPSSLLQENKDEVEPELSAGLDSQFDETTFKPGAAFSLELDFLESCGQSSGEDHISDLARQSLYVKFDPLVEARKPEQDASNLENINPADFLFRGPLTSDDLLGMDTPPEKPVVSRRALLAQTQSSEEAGESTATPSAAPIDLFESLPSQDIPAAEKAEEETPTSENDVVVAKEESPLVQPLQFSKEDLDKAVKEAVESEKETLSNQFNQQTGLLEAEVQKLLADRNKMVEERNKLRDENKVVKTLMMEYEQTMARMIKDRENEKSQEEKLNSKAILEREQLQRDLNNTEKSFAHLHEKYGKLKTAIESFQKNEEVLKKVVKDLQGDVKNSEAKYQLLKSQAEQKLQEANIEINRVHTSYKAEMAKFEAASKRDSTKISSLQQSLNQKINENKELTAICDELISKVGPMQ